MSDSPFSPPSFEEWKALAEKTSGKPLGSLTRAIEGLDVAPLYVPGSEAPEAAARASTRGWAIGARHVVRDLAAASERIREDLENGVTRLELMLEIEADALVSALGVPIAIDARGHVPRSGYEELSIAPDADPPPGVPVRIDGAVVHDAGATALEELVAVLAATKRIGESVVAVRVAATHDQFLTTAKVRAMRQCLALLGVRWPVDAVTSARMPRVDLADNLVRNTVAAFGAAAAGVRTLTVLPYDEDAESQRLARNVQLVLLHETDLARVADPGGGSPYLEALTRELVDRAWQRGAHG